MGKGSEKERRMGMERPGQRQRWMARIEVFDAKGKNEAGFKILEELLVYGYAVYNLVFN